MSHSHSHHAHPRFLSPPP